MKKLLFLLPLLAIFSCSPDRVLIEELTNIGTEERPMFYHNGEPFTGIAFKVFPNSREIMKPEFTIKDGKPDGYYETQLPNGFEIRSNWKNGKLDGVYEKWDETSRLREKSNYKNGVLDGKTEIRQESGGRWTGQYKNGKEDGEWRFFDASGIGGPAEEYEDGELISSYGWPDPEGSGEPDITY